MSYDPLDWYWVADDGRIFASARQTVVAADDAALSAFRERGGIPTRWPVDDAGIQTDAALQDVLTPYGHYLSLAATLAAYANGKQWGLATGGFTITIAGQSLTFSTDTASQALITGKYIRLTQANPPAMISWQFPSGFVAIAMADFVKVASAIADFIQATFDALAQVLTAIKAGTITTTAGVDAAAWPSATDA